jgi:ferritin-like metal-binding protein YciE
MSDVSRAKRIEKYLTDVHSVEVQALAQMRLAPRLVEDAELARMFAEHERETEGHEQAVREQLAGRGARPTAVKDVAGRIGGWGMALFARLNPDTSGKLLVHAYAYEHMEFAAYELLRRFAERAGEPAVATMAVEIGGEERLMAGRLQEHWQRAIEVSLAEKSSDDLAAEVLGYLRDARSLEAQSLQLLQSGARVLGVEALLEVFAEHEHQTREHQRLLDERLAELGSGPSRLQDGALRLGAVALTGFFSLQPDTPVKLAGFAYAFEALEQAAYALLSLTARRAQDERTEEIAEHIAGEEQQAALRLAGSWDAVVEAMINAR